MAAVAKFACVEADKINRSASGLSVTRPLSVVERQSRTAELALERTWRDTFTEAEATAYVLKLSRYLPV